MSKVMIITGASRGIGAATAQLAAQRGYSVCVNFRTNRDAAEGVVEAIRGNGGKAIAVAATWQSSRTSPACSRSSTKSLAR